MVWFKTFHSIASLFVPRYETIAPADKKLAAVVDSERDRILALKHKLEVAEDAARAATRAGRVAAEGEASGRRAAKELAELAREQKVTHQTSLAWGMAHPEP